MRNSKTKTISSTGCRADKTRSSSSSPSSSNIGEQACVRCRDRKVRCGREKDQCANCKRDGVVCEYSPPGKRVNHVKLLCNHVASIQDRLMKIEGELSRLPKTAKPTIDETDSASRLSGLGGEEPPEEEGPSLLPNDRNIAFGHNDSVDRYYGLSSLFSLCSWFREATLAESKKPLCTSLSDTYNTVLQNKSALENVLNRMCIDAHLDDFSFDMLLDQEQIRLPPKHFVLGVQAQFFQEKHYTTDIFVEAHFRASVERLYSQNAFSSDDEPWAICFKAVILLVLGVELFRHANDPLFGSQFAQSFLSTVRTALSNPRFLMVPKLINVQALILLSVVARLYYPHGFPESILSQACILARTMGLHQTHFSQDGTDPYAAEERFKVFRSLYVQDKSFSVLYGSICWLPSFDCNIANHSYGTSSTPSVWDIRLQLAQIQEEIYQLLSLTGCKKMNSTYSCSLSRINTSLDEFVKTYNLFFPFSAAVSSVDLQLEFLATRIIACAGSTKSKNIAQALNDSRTSCLLLIRGLGRLNDAMSAHLDCFLADLCSSSHDGMMRCPSSIDVAMSQSETLRLTAVLESFSVPAFFILAKNLLWPHTPQVSHATEDLEMLQTVHQCFREVDTWLQTRSRISKTRLAFARVLEIIDIIQASGKAYTTRELCQDEYSIPVLPEFDGVLDPSIYLEPPFQFESYTVSDSSSMSNIQI
ncbi:hypothetical protein BGW36DRAFT_456441 [Talaromyces proteolyticus]|uniref:Zn(2)-C6 fungal-type domain-containing protein n=1 Tax=Talaromyces proteolyticus TaxID=1131652 RepID=A0AAD4L2P5_9EURO|nr:uncharacterized protein BGW36DRAFT_456441 [Talaromyces proteolyticus]KAH8704873.1 hypothetical protein BGW36DRAFT_456441 [Talaromyces proteolyticus]